MTGPDRNRSAGDIFDGGARYDDGVSSAVAVNAGNVTVEVHQSQKEKTLWYHVGRIDGDAIRWGKSIEYDDGVNPSVALTDDGLVVEVHQSQRNMLWYHVGRIDGDAIRWGKSIKYDDGVSPSVAVTEEGLVVEVHESQKEKTIWYRTGRIDGDTIEWGKSIKYDDGVSPSVAVTDDGLVVEVHQSQKEETIWYRTGRIDGDTIKWGRSVRYDTGITPSVALTRGGLVLEVHQSQNFETLWHRRGQVDGDQITWRNGSRRYAGGRAPGVTCNAGRAVEVHTSDKELFGSVMDTPPLSSDWIDLQGKNAYSYCSCERATDAGQRHESSHALSVRAGAPYLYVALTRGVDSAEFPTGAVMTVTGPDGTEYDRNLQDENKLVIMSGSSVRCLIVKNPRPGDWKLSMVVPEGVEFWCVCNTVPSADVYQTLESTARLSRRGLPLLYLLAGAGALIAIIAASLSTSKLAADLAKATYRAMGPENAAWVSEFMWGGSADSILSTKAIRGYHQFLTEFADRLNTLADRLNKSGYRAFGFPDFVNWFGRNFSEQEYNVVVNAGIPVHRVLFVYALVYFDVRHMTDADEQNAVRHALWQCYLKKAFGADFARQIGDAHEDARPGTDADNKADEINNIRGQELADRVKAPYMCFAAAHEMWERGELQKRADLEGDPT